jgi:hypothetical protein
MTFSVGLGLPGKWAPAHRAPAAVGGMVAVRAGYWLAGKALTDMGAADLGADLAELRWPDTMPDAASEAGDESGEICLRAGRCCGGRRARLPGRPHGW